MYISKLVLYAGLHVTVQLILLFKAVNYRSYFSKLV